MCFSSGDLAEESLLRKVLFKISEESSIGKKLNSFKIYDIVGEIMYSTLKKVR